MLTHASLFSGIGGFDLAAEWAGWENIFHCEWNPFGQKVLAHHFPNSKSYNDITKTDFTIHAGTVDVLTGGFPCQPYSSAGKRLGKADERHLFPEMLRAIKEIKPRWVVGENVRGLVSWNEGLVFNEVYADLESEGYEVQSFLIPAAGVNAPHQRYRIWFVAFDSKSERNTKVGEFCKGQNTESIGIRSNDKQKIAFNSNDQRGHSEFGNVSKENGEISERNENAKFSDSSNRNVTNSELEGLERQYREWEGRSEHRENKGIFVGSKNKFFPPDSIGERGQLQATRQFTSKQMFGSDGKKRRIGEWESFPTQSPICSGNDGISNRLDGITFSKWRNESIKAYGNAIVPQVAFEIFKAINEFELLVNK
jgi:DNA (cytosine-5)-methyltransferase 1